MSAVYYGAMDDHCVDYFSTLKEAIDTVTDFTCNGIDAYWVDCSKRIDFVATDEISDNLGESPDY